MKLRHVTVALLACLWTLPVFALHFGEKARLWDHLMEVNVQWEYQVQERTAFQEMVTFDSDVERIQTHLFLVESILRNRNMDHLSPAQRANRLRHLRALREYQQAGKFPKNLDFRDRTPYFIDAEGTACAVGHLLLEDGQQTLVDRIHKEMNYAYLLDMPYAEIGAWAEANGFTPQELAWIQPAYEFPDLGWAPLGGAGPAFNGDVRFIYEDKLTGRVILSGGFTNVGGQSFNHIVAWNGINFTGFGNGISGEIYCALNHNNKLYFGGTFNNGAANLAVWDGSSWSYSQVYTGTIRAIVAYNGHLAIGGDLTHSGGALVQHILEGDVGTWVSIGQGFDAPVRALTFHNGDLYAGGEFQNSGATPMAYISKWDGTAWQSVGGGLESPVNTLATLYGDIYAGGKIFLPATSQMGSFGVARLLSTSWEPMLDTNQIAGTGLSFEVTSLKSKEGKLLVGGEFVILDTSVYSTDVGILNITGKRLEHVASTDARIKAFDFFGTMLVIGGTFSYVAPYQIPWVATKGIIAGVDAPGDVAELRAYPLPATQSAKVDLSGFSAQAETRLDAWDISGRRVALDWSLSGSEALVQRNDLPAGQYFLRFMEGDQLLGTATIVFQ